MNDRVLRNTVTLKMHSHDQHLAVHVNRLIDFGWLQFIITFETLFYT